MKYILILQSLYFFITGMWPIVHINSFVKVTGPKTDVWLVKTVGLLVTCISLALFAGAFGDTNDAPIIVLAISSAFSLFIIDIYYSLTGVISLIYLLDAFLELLFLSAMLYIYFTTGI